MPRRYCIVFLSDIDEQEIRFEFTHKLTDADYLRSEDCECILIDNFTKKINRRWTMDSGRGKGLNGYISVGYNYY